MTEDVEPDLQNDNIGGYGKIVRLLSDKADCLRMSVDEKVHCYLFDDNGTNTAFEMVQVYFKKIGMDTSFHSVYDEEMQEKKIEQNKNSR